MYAIVKTGGKQYRVEEGQTLVVERLPGEAGASLQLEPLLLRSDETLFGGDLGKVTISAEVVEHLRGPKLRVNKFKPKRGYRRRAGHRQELTRIRVTEIAGPKAQRRAAARAERRAAAPKAERRSTAPRGQRRAAASAESRAAAATAAPQED